MVRVALTILCVLFLSTPCFGATENLDELVARMARYSGQIGNWSPDYLEDSTNNYFWVPETVVYHDVETGKEVWIIAKEPDGQVLYHKEPGIGAWSGDGSRIGFFNLYGLRTTNNPDVGSSYDHRFVVNTDGTGLRFLEGPGRDVWPLDGFSWATTEPATYYTFGSRNDDNEGAGYRWYKLYKVTLDSNNDVTVELVVDTSGTNSFKKELVKNGIAEMDTWAIYRDALPADARDLSTPNEIDCLAVYFTAMDGSPVVDNTWGIARGCGPAADPYGDHVSTDEVRFHSCEALPSMSTLDTYPVLMGSFSGSATIWAFKKSGNDTDGGPQWEDWDGDSFGTNEQIRALSDGAGTPDNPYGFNYWGHITFDRWGHYGIVGDYDDTDKGTRIVNLHDKDYEANYPMHKGWYDGQHHSWAGWTDYVIGVCPAAGSGAPESRYYDIDMNLYTTDQGETQLCSTHVSYVDNYNAWPRPVQSPDGTKVAFSAHWLNNSTDDYPYISYVVAYFPYPPEITQATAVTGTVTIRFDWRLDQVSPRGYTTRGWPDETTDDPPPPRETKLFRLWKSTNNVTWTPVTTTNAVIFTKYNFATGAWIGGQNSYWEISTSQAVSSTMYYAITALEWSGLESRSLSNTWKVVLDGDGNISTQAEETTYPSSPGADGNFYNSAAGEPTSQSVTHCGTGDCSAASPEPTANGHYLIEWDEPADTTIVRYYNIYAEDVSAPAAIQQDRIASIPKSICSGGSCMWVDWLGNTGGTTQYRVTSVTYQGDESTVTSGSSSIGGCTITGVTLQ